MKTSEQRSLGARVRLARTAAGLSLRDTAQRLGVSPATLSAVENGKTGVSAARLIVLAETFGVPASTLLGETPAPEPHRPTVDVVRAARSWRSFPPLDIDPVLAAAIAAFVETGYHGATMRTIAQRAGMSVPGVYHHYRDKQDLLVRALDLTMDELHLRVSAARAEAATGRDRVARAVEALALFHTHRRELAFIGASEMRSLSPDNRRRIAASRNAIQHQLDDDIDAALTEAGLDTRRARAAGRAIATMCTSLPQWFRLGGAATPEQIATEYADFALGMLGIDGHRQASP
ncbi:TetR family transcriptional regulator [Nocardia sp. AG03]|uniref:TetR family transcriptional regulator n=1 Tax=Nocardia sp. AG03 TaxID=3025312 RepID=UPI0024186869|nr:TetR family transcriptional regulator [Nocardia sp. AG03]